MILKWWRKVRRRKGGVYGARTNKHRNPFRREWGYIGESVNLKARELDHMGKGRYGQAAKLWSDLDPAFHCIIRLPWWLCWKPVLRSLETLVIFLTWPRYNVAKNKWNPRRVPPALQARQRAQRDAGAVPYRVYAIAGRVGRITMQAAGLALIMLGVVATVMNRG